MNQVQIQTEAVPVHFVLKIFSKAWIYFFQFAILQIDCRQKKSTLSQLSYMHSVGILDVENKIKIHICSVRKNKAYCSMRRAKEKGTRLQFCCKMGLYLEKDKEKEESLQKEVFSADLTIAFV